MHDSNYFGDTYFITGYWWSWLCGPGIRTITATGCRERDTHRELTVLTLVAEELPAETDVAATLPLRPPVQVQPTQKSPQARYGKNAIQNFFHNNFPSLNEGDLPKNISGGIEYTQLKHANTARGISDGVLG